MLLLFVEKNRFQYSAVHSPPSGTDGFWILQSKSVHISVLARRMRGLTVTKLHMQIELKFSPLKYFKIFKNTFSLQSADDPEEAKLQSGDPGTDQTTGRSSLPDTHLLAQQAPHRMLALNAEKRRPSVKLQR